jgi:hypothetical protein
MTTLIPFIKNDFIKSDGKCNIKIRLSHDRKMRYLKTPSYIELVYYNEDQIKTNLSDYLREKLNHNYTYLSNLFSEIKGTSIENFACPIR